MNNMNDPGRELGWEDEIENEGSPRVVLEPGEYPFTVQSFVQRRPEAADDCRADSAKFLRDASP